MRKKILNFKKHRAITLIELLIYLAITMIVLVVIIDLVTRIAQNRNFSSGQAATSQNARFLADRFTYAVGQASKIEGTYPADTLSLTTNGQSIVFSLSGGQVFYKEGSGPKIALTDPQVAVSGLTPGENIFQKITNGGIESVQIKFKVTFKQTGFDRDFETTALAKGK